MQPDPWLSSRMADYAAVRRAEAELYPVVQGAIEEFLGETLAAVQRQSLTAAAFATGEDIPGTPGQSAWRRLVTGRIAPAVRRLWQSAYDRLAPGRQGDPGPHTDTLADRLAAFPGMVADRLRAALGRGESPDKLRDRLAALMTLEEWNGQALTMTRREVIAALNSGALHAAMDEEERTGRRWEKRWQSTPDTRTRPTHRDADGQLRPLAEPFHVGGHRFQFPGDPTGPPGETFNCRCAIRCAPAQDPSLTASAQEEPPMPIKADPDYRSVYGETWRSRALTALTAASSPISVSPDGSWRGAIGFMDEWSADLRMLKAPEGGAPVRSRPLPLPMLVQAELNDGHDRAKLGLSRLDRVWVEGNMVMGEGQFDMEDPLAVEIARKVERGFMRFVSLDVDDATMEEVCLDAEGRTLADCETADSATVGRIYSDWRVMGLTLLAHPAFPDAFIALRHDKAEEMEDQALTAASGCVAPAEDGTWVTAECDAEGAVPANPEGTGPAEEGQEAPVTDDDPEEESEEASDPETVEDVETVEDDGRGCVAPTEDGGWAPAECDAEGAVPANAEGTGPAEEVTDAANEVELSDIIRGVSITASSAPGPLFLSDAWTPPAEWFEPPQDTEPRTISMDPQTGRLSGWLAPWDSCHIGHPGRCVPPPRSATDYSYFNLRPVRTTGGVIHCGLLTMATGHAPLDARASAAMAHYDNTGTQCAVVRVGEDQHGIWAAGAALPDLTDEQRLRLSLSSFSGDWREVRGGMELIAALAVNSPGFPLAARRTGDAGSDFSLVASGWPPGHLGAQPGTQVAGQSVEEVADLVLERISHREDTARRRRVAVDSLGALRSRLVHFRAQGVARRMEQFRRDAGGTDLPDLTNFPEPSEEDIEFARNWVDRQGGLPSYIKRISQNLQRKGMDKSRAIATAVNVVKKMCRTGDTNWPGKQNVNAASRTKACAAMAEWEAMKARANAS